MAKIIHRTYSDEDYDNESQHWIISPVRRLKPSGKLVEPSADPESDSDQANSTSGDKSIQEPTVAKAKRQKTDSI